MYIRWLQVQLYWNSACMNQLTDFYYIHQGQIRTKLCSSQVQPDDLKAQLGSYATVAEKNQDESVSSTHFHQHWYFESSSDAGYLYIISRKNGLVLHVQNPNPLWIHKTDTFVVEHKQNSPPAQLPCQIEKDDFITLQMNGQVLSVRLCMGSRKITNTLS